jgi:protease-4
LREIELTKKTKPIVVSITTQPLVAITSLVMPIQFCRSQTQLQDQLSFGILPNFTPLANKIGINTEQVETHQNANYSPFVSIDENFKAVTLEGVEHIYKTFVTHVAEGRKMTLRK